jgi:hypothetical protein
VPSVGRATKNLPVQTVDLQEPSLLPAALQFVCTKLNRRFRSSSLLSFLPFHSDCYQRAVQRRVAHFMKLGYDIFQKLDDGSPLWIANVQTRAQALQKVTALRRSAAARYFVRGAETGVVINDCEPGTVGSTDEGG